jgi:hypothetical protein
MESQLHKLLKNTVTQELQYQKYTIYLEPQESPFKRMWWHSYRPDILGILSNNSDLLVVLVECETKPNRLRVMQKTSQIKHVFSLQKRLNENHVILPLLVIPPMNLHKVNCLEVRRFWEVWIVNYSREILHKLPRIRNLPNNHRLI